MMGWYGDMRVKIADFVIQMASSLDVFLPEERNVPNFFYHIHGKYAVSILIRHLGSSDFTSNEQALDALIRIGKPAVPSLLEALKDKDRETRSDAAYILASLGENSALPILFCMLKDNDSQVQQTAFEGLNAFVYNCKSGEQIKELAKKIEDCLRDSRKMIAKLHKSKGGFDFEKLSNAIAKKRNELAQDKGIILTDIPKPPKKGRAYRSYQKAILA
jgi:hypothetical protein